MTNDQSRRPGFIPRLVTTAAIGMLFAVIAAFVKVPTSLGVRVSRPRFGEPDLSGRDSIWRVWWRARDDLLDVSPQWPVTAALIALLVAFAVGTLLAIWVVTAPQDDDIASADG